MKNIKKLLMIPILCSLASGVFAQVDVLEDDKRAMTDACKNSVANLYKESVDYPFEFVFHNVEIDNSKPGLYTVHLEYTAKRSYEDVVQKMSCDFTKKVNSSYSEKQNVWTMVHETRSY